MRRFIVKWMEKACDWTHPIVHHRPWLWLPLPVCPLAHYSGQLDERWKTGWWQLPDEEGGRIL